MATCLSLLTSLESLQLDFIPPPSLSYPDLKNRRPFPPTRSVLPTLTKFWFKGLNEYLQEFVARIDTPQLSSITFSDVIDFDTPEINRFISRTPTFGAYDEAHLTFHSHWVLIRLRQSHPGPSDHRMVQVKILGEESDRQLSILAKICTLSLRLLLTMENLYINVAEYTYSVLVWVDDIENTEWFDLLLPFTAVKNLYLSKPVSPRIALALQKLTWERTTEVFPALQTILLEGFQPERVHKGITRFMSARQLINHPVAISVWDRSLKGDKS